MSRYAERTTVSTSGSRSEIESVLKRYGATAFGSGWDADQAFVQFRIHDRHVRLLLPLPSRDSDEFQRTPSTRRWRSEEQAERAWEAACRQRWRTLLLIVKAKLEAVEAGITTIEREFLSDVVLPDGRTVGDFMHPQIEQSYLTGGMPRLLPAAGNATR